MRYWKTNNPRVRPLFEANRIFLRKRLFRTGNNFFSSNFTSNRNITKGILKVLYKWQQNGISIKRDHFVQANKYLNVTGGAMILDMLETEEVEEMMEKYLKGYYGIKVKRPKWVWNKLCIRDILC